MCFRTPIGENAPIGEIAPGCDKKHNVETFKNAIAPGANLRMITVREEFPRYITMKHLGDGEQAKSIVRWLDQACVF